LRWSWWRRWVYRRRSTVNGPHRADVNSAPVKQLVPVVTPRVSQASPAPDAGVNQLGPRPEAVGHGVQAPVKSGHQSIVAPGEQQQVRLRDCAAAVHALGDFIGVGGDAHRVRPGCMAPDGPQLSKESCCLPQSASVFDDSVIARDPDEPRFGHRAGCPAFAVDMRWSRKGHNDMHVEQADHASSIASRTISGVIGRASGRTSNVGRPVDADVECRSASPRRARSETMNPRGRTCSRDSLWATARTWSSISRVVRVKSG
jgi:hypothetical protein